MEKKGSEEEDSKLILSSPLASSCQQYPWLILIDGDDSDRFTFYNMTDDRYYVRHVPAAILNTKYISSYCFGHFFVNKSDESYLLNMSTMETVQLPPLPQNHFYTCVLSSPPVDRNCFIFVIEVPYPQVLMTFLGHDEFIEINLNLPSIVAATTFRRKLFAVVYGNFGLWSANLDGAFDLHMTQVFRGDALQNLLIECTDTRFYLIESCGELLFISVGRNDSHDGPYIQIFKADFDNKEWMMLKTLGDRAIFLDNEKALVCPVTKFRLKENCVYYVNKWDRNLYTYNFEDQSTTMSLPCPIVSKDVFPTWAI